jgi:DNA-binding transcriptional LysR family regulator
VRMQLTHLEALAAVADCGSFAKAAKRLNKVRSAVSYDVRCLEEQLGVILLDRSGYRARLTDAGDMVLREGRPLLSQARALEHIASLLSEGFEPVIRMVVEGAVPMPPVMRAIKALTQRDVPTLVELQTEFLGGVPERFEREQADLMLVKDFDASRESYAVTALPEVDCVLVASPEHSLIVSGLKIVEASHLRAHLELNIQVVDGGTASMSDRRVGGARVLNLSGFYTKKEALLLGLGYGWMPTSLIADELADGRLVIVPFDQGASFQFTPALMHRRDRPLGRAGSLFKALLLEAFDRAG